MQKPLNLFLSILLLFLCSSCGGFYKTVKYTVSGTSNHYSVTYSTKDGGTSQEGNIQNNWTYTFKTSMNEFLYISAQNQLDSGSVTVKIYINGSLYKTTTSSGPYVIASASGPVK